MAEAMRIAQIMGKMDNGGVEAIIMNYYTHIDKSKIQFDFIIDSDSTCPQEEKILSMGGRVFRIAPYQKLLDNKRDLEKLFKENKYNIVHSNLNTLSVFSMRAAKKCGVPIRICHNHSSAGKGERVRNIMKYTLRPFAKLYPTHLVACSEYAGRWMYGNKAFDSGRVKVIANAINTSKFEFSEEIRSEVRRELSVNDEVVVGHIGRFCTTKNHDFLLKIFSEIHKKRPDSVLLLAGEGELEETIRSQAAGMGLAACVRFLGVRKDANRLYQAFDCFLLPSLYEGLPVVGVEAQTSGLPCFFSDTVTSEAKLLPETRFISLEKTAGEWADAVLSSGQRNMKAREIVEAAGFDIEKQAKGLEKFYGQFI